MAYEVTWTETTPLNTDEVLEGALRIRETKQGVRERVNRDHFFGGATGAAMAAESGLTETNDSGYHRRVTLQERSSYESTSRSRINTVNSGATTKFGEIFLAAIGSSAELKFTSSTQNTRTLVSTAQNQTLTNKTLTSPTINSATIDMNSGTIDNAVIGGATKSTAMFTKVGINTSLPGSDGDLTVGNILTVNGASTFTGTATLNGSITLAGTTTLTGNLAGAKFRTEDDFGSASATSVASSLSIKNFVQSGNYTFTNKTYSNPTISGTISPSGALTWNNTTVVANLNADLLDGSHGSHYLNPANFSSAVPVAKGGTGTTSLAGANIVATSSGSSSFSTADGDYRSHGINSAYIESHNNGMYMIYTVKNGTTVTQRGTQSYHNLALVSSDRQWKENIQPTKVHSLPIIDKMSFKSFDWKEDSPEKGHVDVGLIAQELAEIYPEGVKNDIITRSGLVPCDKEGNIMQEKEMGLKPVALQMLMLKAIQELSAEVKALKA